MKKPPERLFFVHIPKTAGTSLRTAISDAVGGEHCNFVSTMEEHRRFPETMAHPERWRVAGGHYELYRAQPILSETKLLWGVFTVLRDPLKRLLSEFAYRTMGGHPEHAALHAMPFAEFARAKQGTYRHLARWIATDGMFETAHAALLAADVTVYRTSEYRRMLRDLSRSLQRKLSYHEMLVAKAAPEVELEHLNGLLPGLREDYLLYVETLKGSYRDSLNAEGQSPRAGSPGLLEQGAQELQIEIRASQLSPEAVIHWQARVRALEAQHSVEPPGGSIGMLWRVVRRFTGRLRRR